MDSSTGAWVWVGPRDPALTRRALVVTASLVVAGTLAWFGLGAWAMTGDWDGTPHPVTNRCGYALAIDHGHDGFTIRDGETVSLAGFPELRVTIRPAGDLGGARTQATADGPLTIEAGLCPSGVAS